MGTIIRGRKYHGMADHGLSRYFALYTAQLGWVLLGVYFLRNAYWPSTCTPSDFVEIYSCSAHLPDNRGWVESALMTWLWGTPILIALEFMRHYKKRAR